MPTATPAAPAMASVHREKWPMPARSAASSDGPIASTGASASRSRRMLRTIQPPHATM